MGIKGQASLGFNAKSHTSLLTQSLEISIFAKRMAPSPPWSTLTLTLTLT